MGPGRRDGTPPGRGGPDPGIQRRSFTWDFPTIKDGVDFFVTNAGPFLALIESAQAQGHDEDEVKDRLHQAMADTNRATDGTVSLNAPYLLAIAHP